MKFYILLMVCFIAVTGLSACKTTADTRNDRYSIDLDNDQYHGNGKFCPPGQAKKGRC